nr:hypothetical protein [Tanacetum cinerariifolium]
LAPTAAGHRPGRPGPASSPLPQPGHYQRAAGTALEPKPPARDGHTPRRCGSRGAYAGATRWAGASRATAHRTGHRRLRPTPAHGGRHGGEKTAYQVTIPAPPRP